MARSGTGSRKKAAPSKRFVVRFVVYVGVDGPDAEVAKASALRVLKDHPLRRFTRIDELEVWSASSTSRPSDVGTGPSMVADGRAGEGASDDLEPGSEGRGKPMLLSALQKASLPRLYATEHLPEDQKVAQVRVFDPCGRGTWYLVEHDGDDLCFGFVVSPLGPDCDEWGYMSLTELQEVRNRWGLPLEVDLSWRPGPIPEVADA